MRDALDPQVIPANSSVKVAANAKVSVSSPETQSELSGRLQQSTTASVKKSDLLALAKTMISNSFPALSGMRLKVKIVDTEDYVMSVSLESEEIHLDVSREDAARMGRSVTAGVLAHELCHAEEDCRHGPFLEALFSWLYERIPRLETRMERRIDSAVIRKGYGNELLAFQQYHDWHYEPYDQTDGLTVEEIKEALQNCQCSMSRQLCEGSSNGPSLSITDAGVTQEAGRKPSKRDRNGSAGEF